MAKRKKSRNNRKRKSPQSSPSGRIARNPESQHSTVNHAQFRDGVLEIRRKVVHTSESINNNEPQDNIEIIPTTPLQVVLQYRSIPNKGMIPCRITPLSEYSGRKGKPGKHILAEPITPFQILEVRQKFEDLQKRYSSLTHREKKCYQECLKWVTVIVATISQSLFSSLKKNEDQYNVRTMKKYYGIQAGPLLLAEPYSCYRGTLYSLEKMEKAFELLKGNKDLNFPDMKSVIPEFASEKGRKLTMSFFECFDRKAGDIFSMSLSNDLTIETVLELLIQKVSTGSMLAKMEPQTLMSEDTSFESFEEFLESQEKKMASTVFSGQSSKKNNRFPVLESSLSDPDHTLHDAISAYLKEKKHLKVLDNSQSDQQAESAELAPFHPQDFILEITNIPEKGMVDFRVTPNSEYIGVRGKLMKNSTLVRLISDTEKKELESEFTTLKEEIEGLSEIEMRVFTQWVKIMRQYHQTFQINHAHNLGKGYMGISQGLRVRYIRHLEAYEYLLSPYSMKGLMLRTLRNLQWCCDMAKERMDEEDKRDWELLADYSLKMGATVEKAWIQYTRPYLKEDYGTNNNQAAENINKLYDELATTYATQERAQEIIDTAMKSTPFLGNWESFEGFSDEIRMDAFSALRASDGKDSSNIKMPIFISDIAGKISAPQKAPERPATQRIKPIFFHEKAPTSLLEHHKLVSQEVLSDGSNSDDLPKGSYAQLAPLDCEKIAAMEKDLRKVFSNTEKVLGEEGFYLIYGVVEMIRRTLTIDCTLADKELNNALKKALEDFQNGKPVDIMKRIESNYQAQKDFALFCLQPLNSSMGDGIRKYAFKHMHNEILETAFSILPSDTALDKEALRKKFKTYVKKNLEKIMKPLQGKHMIEIRRSDLVMGEENFLGSRLTQSPGAVLPILSDEDRQKYLYLIGEESTYTPPVREERSPERVATETRKKMQEIMTLSNAPEYLNPDGSTSVVIQEWRPGKLPCLMVKDEEYEKSYSDKDRIKLIPLQRTDFERLKTRWDELVSQVDLKSELMEKRFFKAFEDASYVICRVFMKAFDSYLEQAPQEKRKMCIENDKKLMTGEKALLTSKSADIYLAILELLIPVWKKEKNKSKLIRLMVRKAEPIIKLHLKMDHANADISYEDLKPHLDVSQQRRNVDAWIRQNIGHKTREGIPLRDFENLLNFIELDYLFSLAQKNTNQLSRLQILVPELEEEVYGQSKSNNKPKRSVQKSTASQLIIEEKTEPGVSASIRFQFPSSGQEKDVPVEKVPELLESWIEEEREKERPNFTTVRMVILKTLKLRHKRRLVEEKYSNPDHE